MNNDLQLLNAVKKEIDTTDPEDFLDETDLQEQFVEWIKNHQTTVFKGGNDLTNLNFKEYDEGFTKTLDWDTWLDEEAVLDYNGIYELEGYEPYYVGRMFPQIFAEIYAWAGTTNLKAYADMIDTDFYITPEYQNYLNMILKSDNSNTRKVIYLYGALCCGMDSIYNI